MKTIYEIKTDPRTSWSKVTKDIFRSWAGPRRKNGKEYSGPVYYFLSKKIASCNGTKR